MKPEEPRQEVQRPEERRLRLAPEVMGGEPGVIEKDRRLEGRIRDLAHLAEALPADGERRAS